MSSSAAATPEGPGSVSGAPNLPAGFTDTFTGRYIDTGDLRQHVVTGGDGPPLLLVHGWPQTWYAWRLIMPALARDVAVVAPDQRGTGLSGKPQDGYDIATLAAWRPVRRWASSARLRGRGERSRLRSVDCGIRHQGQG